MRCPHCGKEYKKQTAFDKHTSKCAVDVKNRSRLLQRAYPLYSKWFTQNHRGIPTFDTFKSSRFGTHFTKFVQWSDIISISSLDVYADVMIQRKIHPQMWPTGPAYRMYLDDFDRVCTTDQWLSITVNTIFSICEQHGVHPSRFYDVVSPHLLIHLISSKSLYPRYLVCDSRFGQMLATMPLAQHFCAQIGQAIPDHHLVKGDLQCDEQILAVINHINKEPG